MTMIYKFASACLALLSVGLISCTAQQAKPIPDNPTGSWHLVWWNNSLALPSKTITLDITTDEVTGNSSCNAYSGALTIAGSTFRVGQLAVTYMYCTDETSQTEYAYLGLLQAITDWRITDGALILATNGVDELRFTSP